VEGLCFWDWTELLKLFLPPIGPAIYSTLKLLENIPKVKVKVGAEGSTSFEICAGLAGGAVLKAWDLCIGGYVEVSVGDPPVP
jgi:hypothetical protein